MPPLLFLHSEEAYRARFRNILVRNEITTFHGVPVKFRNKSFSHAFFESTWRDRNKDAFSPIRAERMGWIKPTLEDQVTDWYQGWSSKRRRHEITRSASVAYGNFVVVLQYYISRGDLAANFVTCYEAERSIQTIRKSPRWDIDVCRIEPGIENGR